MTIQVKDANGSTKYMQTNGSGTSGDPYRVVHDVNSNALPTGASTAANQATTHSKLDTLHTDIGTTLHADLTAAQPAGENHIGEVSANGGTVVSISPTLDTSAYHSGDVFFTTISLGNIARANDKAIAIRKVTVIDKADQAAADLTLFFFRTNVTFGAVGGAPSISDSDAANLAGIIKIATADWIDLGGVGVAYKECDMLCLPTSGARTLFVAAITGGTGTYGASDLTINIGAELY